MTQTHLPPQWKLRVLWAFGSGRWQDTEALRLLDAWAAAEGGTAQWNPLNTTMYLPGSTNYNTSNVKNYMRATEGVCATAVTLVNGNYNGILSALQAGSLAAVEIVNKYPQQFETWGTSVPTLLSILNQ